MRLFQLLASPPASSHSASSSSSPSSSNVSSSSIPPTTLSPTASSDSKPVFLPSSSVTVPFFSVGGFVECPWYRRAICIADEFVRTQVEQTEQATGNNTAMDDVDGQQQHTSPPQHVRIQSVTLPRQMYRHYLLSLNQHIDLRDHYSCPIILQGECTISGTPQQHAADYPLQHTSVSGGVTGSAVECECKAETLVGGYGEFERLLREQYSFVSTRCGRLAPGNPGGQC